MFDNSKFFNLFLVFFFHFCFLIFFSFFLCFFYKLDDAVSSLLGGLISLISSFLFFFIYFFNKKDISYKGIVRKFYLAGFIKFISFIILFVFAFLYGITNIFLFFASLFICQATLWISCIYFFYGM